LIRGCTAKESSTRWCVFVHIHTHCGIGRRALIHIPICAFNLIRKQSVPRVVKLYLFILFSAIQRDKIRFPRIHLGVGKSINIDLIPFTGHPFAGLRVTREFASTFRSNHTLPAHITSHMDCLESTQIVIHHASSSNSRPVATPNLPRISR
jgi:hypothetical protein